MQSDVGSEEVKEAIAAAVGATGHVQVLVNCAGITHTAPLQDTPPEIFKVIYSSWCSGSHRLNNVMSSINRTCLG